ncbi:MAG: YARHG domain-containing protein [Flavobacteriaceae bacterium]|jgi:hypothetical protein|nr:YARHG domain-containing protein [Flavobacteriaceae bacterium]
MKNIYFILIIFLPIFISAQEKRVYSRGGVRVDNSLVDEKVGDSAKNVNAIFHFKNDTKDFFIKIMNLEGKTYAQGISEHIVLDFNSKKGGDLHRKVEKLTNIKIEDGKFISDQLKASFIYLKEKGSTYGRDKPPIKLMVCSKSKNNISSCRINDDDAEITPEEFPGKYPYTSFVRLGVEDLKNKKPKELNLMKKEIYARYGYRFSDKADADYFFSQNWYEPVVSNKLIELNDLEIDNIAMINLYEGTAEYKDLNKKSYSHIFPLETTSSTLYDKDALKNVKYIKQDSIKGSQCTYTEYNKKGIAVSQQNCMINDYNYVNYFNKDIPIQQINRRNNIYFYYNKNGLLSKTVKLDYDAGSTEEIYYSYDNEENIIKKEIYQNNDYNSTIYYDYDLEGNMVKEYYKDENGKEEMATEYFYDEDKINTGYLKNKETGCNYTYNDTKDIVLDMQCYKIINNKEYVYFKREKKELKTDRAAKYNRITSLKLFECENYKYSLSLTEMSYY